METTGPRPLSSDEVEDLQGMFHCSWLKKIALDHRVAQDAVNLGLNFALTVAEAIHAASAIVAKVDVAAAMGAERGARKSKSARCCGGAANAHLLRHASASIERQFFRKSSPRQGRQRSIALRNTGATTTPGTYCLVRNGSAVA
jgi:hypothetical protein